MKQIPIEFSNGKMPTLGSEHAAAYDVYVPEDYELKGGRQIVKLGFCIELPLGWKANMRPRSGFSAKGMEAEVRTTYRKYNGETYVSKEVVRIDADVLLGLIDSDYRNECGAIVKVCSLDVIARQLHEFDTIIENHVYLTKGTRLAQMEVCGDDTFELVEVEEINRDIDRGGGFGHTGAK